MKIQLTRDELNECMKELEYLRNPNQSPAARLWMVTEMIRLKQYEKQLENKWFYRIIDFRMGLRKRKT